ncbi:universal stress protein [Acidithiobacillus sp. AMEEHan]|uniref:universal stress protein n=1 Tax=Acidithiobacillus sp. AMEEHan TaxID=2994951 RepID=UPI0027E5BD3C|nr:universal stress protein [Acidithiobacillus sp. AMEEHan]
MFKTILLAVDGSAASESAALHAFTLTQAYHSTLHILTVVDVYGAYYATPESIALLQEEGRELLQKFARQTNERGITPQTHLLETDASGSRHIGGMIVAIAKKIEADLLVLGSHGLRGWREMLMGSVATEVSQTAHCSVLIARD